MGEIGTIEQEKSPAIQNNKPKNLLGGESRVTMRTLRKALNESEKSELLKLMSRVKTKAAQLILEELCSDSGAMRGDTIDYRIMPILPEEIIDGLSDPEIDWIAGIFLRLFVAKEIREMEGYEAFEYMKKHFQYANIVAFTTLMRQVCANSKGVNIAEVIKFVKLNTSIPSGDARSERIYFHFLKKLEKRSQGRFK